VTDEATPTEGAAETADAPTPSVDFGPILDRFSQFESKLEALQPQPEPETAPDPYAELDNYYEDPAQSQDARRVLESILNPAIEQSTQALRDEIKALKGELSGLTTDLDLGDLEARYPRLADDREYNQALLQEAEQFAQQIGQPDLARNARLIETLHLARVGKERAAAETPAGGVTGLESAGGATPGQPAPNLAQSIVQAGGGNTPGRELWGF
jgi:hypothetical protein